MSQYNAWENEYRRLSLLTGKANPQNDLLRFLKYLEKEENIELNGLNVLDLGSGTGRNTNYMQSLGNKCLGLEFSETALKIAIRRAKDMNLDSQFILHDIGTIFPSKNSFFDLILDVTSSNSLNEFERDIYLAESLRVLKPEGYFFVKTLCKDGDKNAQKLLKLSPGNEKDTYYIRELDLYERIFSKEDLIKYYSKHFQIIKIQKKTSYTRFNNRLYKRNFWLLYLKKLAS